MRNHNWLAVWVLVILVLSISACSRAPEATPEPTMTQLPESTAANTPTLPATAVPQATEPPVEPAPSGGSAYPAPTVHIFYDPYPDPIVGDEIEWSQVEALLQNENISEVFQQFTLRVVITLEDGRIFLVGEPAKDEVFKLLDACGEPCNRIRRVSEN